MTEQQDQIGESEQDRRRDRRVKWATVLATTVDAAAKIAELIFRR
jgi:hypothetical protein